MIVRAAEMRKQIDPSTTKTLGLPGIVLLLYITTPRMQGNKDGSWFTGSRIIYRQDDIGWLIGAIDGAFYRDFKLRLSVGRGD